MRTPKDLSTAPLAPLAAAGPVVDRRGRRRLHHPAGVAADAGQHLHRRPVVLLGRLPRRVLHPAGGQARALRGLRGHLLRRHVGQPGRLRSPGQRGPRRRAKGRGGPPLPADRAALRRTPLHRPGHRHGAHRRLGHDRRMAELDPLPPRRQLRGQGSAVPQGRRVLRLQAAVHELRRRLDAGHPDRDADRLHHLPLPQRRDPAPAGHPAGAAGGQGASLGAAGAHRADQGGRLRPAALGPGQRARRLCRRRRVHRRARPAAGAAAAGRRLDLRRRHPALQHPSPGLDAARPGRGDLGLRGPRGRRHLPGAPADAEGHPGPVLARGAVHTAQHRGDPGAPTTSTT